MIDEKLFLGSPVEFEHLCLIYPPKVKDIVNNNEYVYYQSLLTVTQEELEDEYLKHDNINVPTPFEYLFIAALQPQTRDLITRAFDFFIHEEVTLLATDPNDLQILIGPISQMNIQNVRCLTKDNYFAFQNTIRLAIGHAAAEPPNPNEDPRVRAIKAKARYRDKIKAKQGKNLTLQTLLASICCMNMGLNPLNIGELSYAAIPILIRTFQMKERYHLDVDSLMAGADSKKVQPKYWITNLDQK